MAELLFENPNTLYEQQLRDIFKAKPKSQSDPLFQILSLVFQSSAHIADVSDVYRLLGLENFIRLIHLLSGRLVRFPNALDLKEAIILTLCYYYRKIENLEWPEIHELLPFEFNSIAISRRIKNMDDEFNKRFMSIAEEDKGMANTQEKARELIGVLGNRQLENEAMRVGSVDPSDELKQTYVQFIRDRASSVSGKEQLLTMLYEKLKSELEEPEPNYDTMEKIVRMTVSIGKGSNEASESILSILRPVPNATSVFQGVTRNADNDEEIKKAHKHYSSEELQTLERVFTKLEQAATKEKVFEAEAEIVSE